MLGPGISCSCASCGREVKTISGTYVENGTACGRKTYHKETNEDLPYWGGSFAGLSEDASGSSHFEAVDLYGFLF